MKAMLGIAAATLLLSSCASTVPATSGASYAAASGRSYLCWKDRLAEEGGMLACNWEGNRSDACRMENMTRIARASVTSGPENGGRCDNGQWLVRVTTK